MPLAGKEAGRRIEADPAGTGQIDLAPGVQIGEVDVGTGRPVERLHIRNQLDQIPRDKAGGQAEMTQHFDQQPGRIAARAAGQRQRLLRALHTRFKADDVADDALHAPVDIDQEIDAGRWRERDRVEQLA